jgi:hypothetical protein
MVDFIPQSGTSNLATDDFLQRRVAGRNSRQKAEEYNYFKMSLHLDVTFAQTASLVSKHRQDVTCSPSLAFLPSLCQVACYLYFYEKFVPVFWIRFRSDPGLFGQVGSEIIVPDPDPDLTFLTGKSR